MAHQITQSQLLPAGIEFGFALGITAQGLTPVVSFFRAHFGGGIDCQAAPKPEPFTGEIQ